MQLYGVRGWGSGIAEAMLALAGVQYDFIDVAGFDQPGASRDKLKSVNPLVQVPTLIMNGHVITESAAIALTLIDQAPHLALGEVISKTVNDYVERLDPQSEVEREFANHARAYVGLLLKSS